MNDLVIEGLVVEEDRVAHIARHEVTIKEILEVIAGDYVFIQARDGRWQLIGQTRRKRYLSIIVGEREEKYVYGLITAWPASRKERSFYKEFIVIKR